MLDRKLEHNATTYPSTTKVMVFWLREANLSLIDQPRNAIILKLLKQTALLYAFFAALYQTKPLTNLLTLNNIHTLKILIDTDPLSTLAALRALDNAGKLTQRSFKKVIQHPTTALFVANKLGGHPDEKDKSIVKNFNELRTTATIFAQGNRTQTGAFFKYLPVEMQMEMIEMICQPTLLSQKVRYRTMSKILTPASGSSKR